jgi:hypothetical protein
MVIVISVKFPIKSVAASRVARMFVAAREDLPDNSAPRHLPSTAKSGPFSDLECFPNRPIT